ncbi:Rhomboid family [Musa troglodytarum]|uniref:Rhomboid family n=1 Tax=Musa troglodytarum TaxID=320322 RepID=A0A9E7IIM9_9LILI|nr:Rhomboid family [Musa troglodytarum]
MLYLRIIQPRSSTSTRYTNQYMLWITAAILVAVGFTIGLVMLFRGVNANDYCPWCRYLSCCIPTSNVAQTFQLFLQSSQEGSNVTSSCEGSSRTHSYFLPDATEAQLQELCSQLCG